MRISDWSSDVCSSDLTRQAEDDGWDNLEEAEPLKTVLHEDSTRHIIAWNKSPDIPFDRSINPYRGCEHGCLYCFARPRHASLGFSTGQIGNASCRGGVCHTVYISEDAVY